MNKVKFKFQKGASMIEVLIALFVLATGMLGVLALQVTSIQVSKNAALYSQATLLANDIVEAARSSPSTPGSYVIAFGNTTPASPACTTKGTNCTPAQIADWNLEKWRTNVETLLPGGESAISRNGDEYTIQVRFVVGYDEETNNAITDTVQIVTVL